MYEVKTRLQINFACKFNLYRYTAAGAFAKWVESVNEVGLYKLRIQLTHSLKAPGFMQPLHLQSDLLVFQSLLFF